MSMTRDAYAKEVLRVAEAVFHGEETVVCPHEGCEERLSMVKQGVFSTRSIFCSVHGHIFQEQKVEPFSKLDWDKEPAEPVDDGEDEWDGSADLFDSGFELYDGSSNN